MNKYITSIGLFAIISSFTIVSAHVTVKPSEVAPGAYQVFTVNVPNEKTVPTVGVRLLVPDGIQSVMPNAKPGWNVQVIKKEVNGETKVTEIVWKGGVIPVDLRDEFLFNAKVPAASGDVVWKAYQTYQDGSVVAWDTYPSSGHGAGQGDPASVTKVVAKPATQNQSSNVLPVVAIVLATLSLLLVRFSPRKTS